MTERLNFLQDRVVDLIQEKLAQARQLMADSDLDVWCTFVRETSESSDPVLPFLVQGGLTWQSALLVFRSGTTVAIVGNYDADPLISSGHWDEVIPYVQSIREPLLSVLNEHVPEGGRIGVNFSADDVKADGLTFGMYSLLLSYLHGTKFELVSAEQVCGSIRSRKTPVEVARIRGAIAETELLFARVPEWCQTMPTELDLYRRMHDWIDSKGFGYAWDRTGDPIVNSGPNSMIGHGIPSADITVSPGHILHIDLGIVRQSYSSDIQRCWYIPERGETRPPADVISALNAVVEAISAGAEMLRPGVEGWKVDEAARSSLVRRGYEEYMHALGHQVGRMAHDGGAILGPKWERYGRTPYTPVEASQVYTLELGVIVPGRGYLGLEEMVVVRDSGLEWLTERQLDMPLL
jgi:Xaa-Pro dipeptidase